mmetsp:Transcript_85483/g.267443  ORF Transcript_85483/g.267443 Transcript_85483/m.267443 type:complete len:259 (-) Transcript_85483:54-830(-)
MKGYWEPHTSSIDFCEENYRFTPYVAELLNSITSLPIAAVGIWAWVLTPPVFRSRLRFVLCWMAFVSIGLGSAAFHATLRRPAQALDEVPMVLASLVFVFCLNNPKEEWTVRLALLLGLAGALLVVVYVVYEFYAVFFIMYGAVVVYLFIHSAVAAFSGTDGPNTSVMRWLWKAGSGTYALGFCLWVTDNLACSQLGVGHLHIAWHGLSCAGTMLFVLLLVAITADKDGVVVARRLHCGVMPHLVVAICSPAEAKKAS